MRKQHGFRKLHGWLCLLGIHHTEQINKKKDVLSGGSRCVICRKVVMKTVCWPRPPVLIVSGAEEIKKT